MGGEGDGDIRQSHIVILPTMLPAVYRPVHWHHLWDLAYGPGGPIDHPVSLEPREERTSPAQGGGVEVLLWSFKTGPVAPVDTSD